MQETNHPDPRERTHARARELVLIERSPMYLLAVYGGIYEARVDDLDDETPIVIPFIPYPFQIEVFFELEDILRTRGPAGDAALIKARDMGLSNLVSFWVARHWLVRKVFQARMLSRREDLVDQTGNPDSLFWKIETFLMGLPEWVIQHFATGFDWKRHRLMMRLINPRTMNLISGESTQSNAGRGGRATVIIYDEGCFMPDLGAIWTAGRASTNHRVLISTVSLDRGMDCFNLVHGEGGYEQPRVLLIPWSEHPLHDLAWLAQERKRDTDEGFRREVLMDWNAGTGDWVYPETHQYETGVYPYLPGEGDFYVAIDDGFDDDFAIIFFQIIHKTGRVRVLDAYSNKHKPVDFYGSLLRGKPRSDFQYGRRELELMAWLRDMPPFTAVGDPHVTHREQVSGMSVYDRLVQEWDIVVMSDPVKRTPKDIRTATGAILPLTDFNNTQGAAEVLEALQRWRFPSRPEGRDYVNEDRAPIHSKYSHYAMGFGYFAINKTLFDLMGSTGRRMKFVGARSK